jgi:hypothetical protein
MVAIVTYYHKMSKVIITEETIVSHIVDAVNKLGPNPTNTEKNTAIRNLLSNYLKNNSFDVSMQGCIEEFEIPLVTAVYLELLYGKVTKP